jgi:hypothetical protein
VPVADYQPTAGLIDLAGQRRDVCIGLGFQCRGQHASSAFSANLVQHRRELLAR